MKSFKLFTGITLLVANHALFAQTCDTVHLTPTTPSSQFVADDKGTVLDLKTGLIWSVCSLGQSFRNGQCLGEATNFTTAYEAFTEAARQGGGWRVPNIKELGSIVERQCDSPAINLSIYPDTPSATFYTSTPFPESTTGDSFRTINFSSGLEYSDDVDYLRHIRLVKDAN